jgi:hypothetical protein
MAAVLTCIRIQWDHCYKNPLQCFLQARILVSLHIAFALDHQKSPGELAKCHLEMKTEVAVVRVVVKEVGIQLTKKCSAFTDHESDIRHSPQTI